MVNRLEVPELTGPMSDPSSWLAWLAHAFSDTPNRFRHMRSVWRRAVHVRRSGPEWLTAEMADRLELAALLHDVGRALDPLNTEPHGFVGARLLDQVGLGDVAPLVAHHSGAQLEAAARGMSHLDQWPCLEPDLLAVLTLLDRTTSPSGEQVSLEQRRLDMIARHGPHSLHVRLFHATMPEVRHAQRLLHHADDSPTEADNVASTN